MSLIKYSIICGLRKPNVDLEHTGKVNWKAYRWKRFSKNNASYIYPVYELITTPLSPSFARRGDEGDVFHRLFTI
jgi:hypothetical protein